MQQLLFKQYTFVTFYTLSGIIDVVDHFFNPPGIGSRSALRSAAPTSCFLLRYVL